MRRLSGQSSQAAALLPGLMPASVPRNRQARRLCGAVLVTPTATATIALLPQVHAGYHWSALHVALKTASSVVALVAALLIVSRFRRRHFLSELMLVYALTVLALSDLLFGTLPMLEASYPSGLTVWASADGSLGALLFALAAIVPQRRL